MKNAIDWFEIPVTDLDRAQGFYEQVLDAKMDRAEMPESQMTMAVFPYDRTQGGAGGSLASGPGQKPSAEGSTIYLNGGDDLAIPLARVEAAGGKVIFPKSSIGVSGFIAHFLDTEGNRVALHSPA
jgi:predicted enzyme related to lactoylglutathione lyase